MRCQFKRIDLTPIVIKEFEDFIKCSQEQEDALESQILSDGTIYDEIKLGRLKDDERIFVIDGMTRIRIAKKNNLKIRYNPHVREFNNYEEVFHWIFDHQKNRRNWSEWQTFLAASQLIDKIKENSLKRKLSGLPSGEFTRWSREQIAKKLGLTVNMVKDAEFVIRNKKEHQEIIELLDKQLISIGQASQRIKNKSREAKNVLTIPNFFCSDPRMVSIFLFFKTYYHCGGKKHYKEVAGMWQDWKDISEDDLSVSSIIKNYERMKIDIEKQTELIKEIIA